MTSHPDPLFATHASPEAIQNAIRDAETTSHHYAKKASALRDLLATRQDQITAGTWPPNDTPTTTS